MNAISHTPELGTIRISLVKQSKTIRFEIELKFRIILVSKGRDHSMIYTTLLDAILSFSVSSNSLLVK